MFDMPKFWRIALVVVMFSTALVFTSFVASSNVYASCGTPAEMGDWVNTDPNTRSITRVHVDFVCQDVVLNGQVGPSYYVHLYGKCSPTDCDWGQVPARRLQSGQIYATYDQGFAKRSVWLAMSKYRSGQLWVEIKTDFTDPGRAGYESQDWFRKQNSQSTLNLNAPPAYNPGL